MNILVFSTRTAVALALGVAIGAERQWRQRTAGIRTNALVALSSALFILMSVMVEGEGSPTRVAAQIISGIGFLGAGVIFKQGFSVSGLNTAATIWATAAVGTLSGFGFLLEALVGTAFIVGSNTVLRLTYRTTDTNAPELQLDYQLSIVCEASDEHHIRTLLYSMISTEPVTLVGLSSDDTDTPGKVAVVALVRADQGRRTSLEQAVSRIGLEASVRSISWAEAA